MERKNRSNLQMCMAWGITAFLVIALSIIFYFCFDRIVGLRTFFAKVFSAVMPVIWGLVIAFMVSPVFNWLRRHLYHRFSAKLEDRTARRLASALGIFLSLMLLVVIIYALIAMIVPQLIQSCFNIYENVPQYIISIRKALYKVLEKYPDARTTVLTAFNSASAAAVAWVDQHLSADNLDAEYLQDMMKNVLPVLTNVGAGIVKVAVFIKNFVIGIIIAIYVLAAKTRMAGYGKKFIYAIFGRKMGNSIVEELRFSSKVLSGFISGKIVDSIIIGILCFFGCLFLNIPYSLLIACVIGITNIIPFFGPFIGAIPCTLFVLLNNPVKSLVFVIFVFLLQQLDGNVIGPKILGDSTGLNSFWVIFALLLFGGLFGVVGMILGVPVFAIIAHLAENLCNSLLRKKNLSEDAEDYILLRKVEDGEYHHTADPVERNPDGDTHMSPAAERLFSSISAHGKRIGDYAIDALEHAKKNVEKKTESAGADTQEEKPAENADTPDSDK